MRSRARQITITATAEVPAEHRYAGRGLLAQWELGSTIVYWLQSSIRGASP